VKFKVQLHSQLVGGGRWINGGMAFFPPAACVIRGRMPGRYSPITLKGVTTNTSWARGSVKLQDREQEHGFFFFPFMDLETSEGLSILPLVAVSSREVL
jgi:hypothetical protein